MARSPLAGSRIRARRSDRALSQAELARAAGISPSYLNLIEHNRRRIGGRLLNRIATLLEVEPATLSEGADADLIEALTLAAADVGAPDPVEATEAFAEAFPAWAGLVARQVARISGLQTEVARLTDRLSHDPQLAASLHDLITTVTSIRSTAAILAGSEALDRSWQDRFHRNIRDDSLRLADAARALAAYLEPPEAGSGPSTPVEAFARFLDGLGHHVAALEGARPAMTPAEVAGGTPGLGDDAGRRLAAAWLDRYRADAEALPLAPFAAAAQEVGHDPELLARRFGAPMGRVLRRLGALPGGQGHPPMGLAVADGAGALVQLKTLPGFTLPRAGPGCPIWPLYRALGQPGRPLRAVVELPGGTAPRLLAYAVAEPPAPAGFDAPPLLEAVMLVRTDPPPGLAPVLAAGISCRVCPRRGCPARREPSILPRND